MRCGTWQLVSPADAVTPWVFWGPPMHFGVTPGAAPKCWRDGWAPPVIPHHLHYTFLGAAYWGSMGGKCVNSFKLTGGESY